MARKTARRASSARSPALTGALAAYRRGDLAEVERRCRRVIARRPADAEALHLLGLARLMGGRADEAEALLAHAVTLEGSAGHGERWLHLGEARRACGDLAGAEAAYREALAAAPGHPQALTGLGAVLCALGRLEEAARLLEEALARAPRAADVHNNLGIVRRAQGDLPAAIEAFRAALAFQPGHPEAELNLCGALRAAGHGDEAVAVGRALVARWPDALQAWWLLAEALLATGELDEAESACRRALALAPGDVDVCLTLSAVKREQQDMPSVIPVLEAAIEASPGHAALHNELGAALVVLGEFGQAREEFARALELNPDAGSTWENLAQWMRFGEADRPLLEAAEAALHRVRADSGDAVSLHFAVAKMRDDLGDTNDAVEHYRAANRLARCALRWDVDEHTRRIERLMAVFDAPFLPRPAAPGAARETLALPIVGMPRSGTSLVEQILASHPAVHGAGELLTLGHFVQVMSRRFPGQEWPECVRCLDEGERAAMAQDYEGVLRARAPGARRVTDKLPLNFLHLGLFALLYPGAQVVHVRREPRATCWSIYTQHFDLGHAWSYDLYEIGRYHADYRRLMAHWRAVLDLDVFELDYERLVAEPEPVCRALLDWAGLEWDPACLAFHRSTRSVHTASGWQVRQPLYHRSVAHWRAFAAWLDELERGLAGAPRQLPSPPAHEKHANTGRAGS